MAAYDEARAALKAKYAGTTGVRAVIEYGTIPLPGISDMDFIVMVEPGTQPKVPGMKEFTPEQQFIFSHRPFVLSDSVHDMLRFIDPWILHATPLLPGTEQYSIEHLRTLTGEEHHWASVRRMLQWSLGFLRFIAKVRATGVFPCRTFLDHCIGIKYFYRELKRMGLAEEDGDPNIPFFVELREQWFSCSEKELQERCEEALQKFSDSLRQFLGILSAHLGNSEQWEVPKQLMAVKTIVQRRLLKEFPHSIVLDTGEEVYVYQEGRETIELRDERFSALFAPWQHEHRLFTCMLPLPLAAYCTNYLRGDGVITKQFIAAFTTDLHRIPMAQSPAIDTFVEMTNRSKEETMNIPLKELFETYGLRREPQSAVQVLQRKITASDRDLTMSFFKNVTRSAHERSVL